MFLSKVVSRTRKGLAGILAGVSLAVSAAGSGGCFNAGRVLFTQNLATDFENDTIKNSIGLVTEARMNDWWYGVGAEYYGKKVSRREGEKALNVSFFSLDVEGREEARHYRADLAAYLDRAFSFYSRNCELEARVGAGAEMIFLPTTRTVYIDGIKTEFIPSLELGVDFFPQISAGFTFSPVEDFGLVSVRYQMRYRILNNYFDNMLLIGIQFK